MKRLLLAVVGLAVVSVALTVAGTASADTAPSCTPVAAHTEYKWVPDVVNAGPTQWTTYNAAANTKTTFPWKGQQVPYHRDGTKSQFVNAVTCNVSEPIFSYDTNTCSVTVPYTPGLDTRLYGVNGYSQDTPITHDVTITAGLDGVAGTAPQFWIGYTAQPGYVDTNPGAGTSHIDFYNGDLTADCAAPVVPGSENFSAYDTSSQPTTFSWGTIDPADYAPGASTPNGGSGGSILVSGPYFNAFSTGITHFLFTGWNVNSAKVTFNNPVQDLQVEAMSNKTDIATHLTLTGYDTANHVVATDSGLDAGYNTVPLHIHSSSANIKYFTVSTDDPNNGGLSYGLGFSNIVWS